MTTAVLAAMLALLFLNALSVTESRMLSFYSSTENCTTNDECQPERFCYNNAYWLADKTAADSGTCLPCWRCCLFPDVFGECPERCACTVDRPCRSICKAGLYCGINRDSAPTCKKCTDCWDDSMVAGAAGCRDVCPAGASASLHAHLVAFMLSDMDAEGNGRVSTQMLKDWLLAEGFQEQQALQRLQVFAGGDSLGPYVPMTDLMAALSDRPGTAALCPALDLVPGSTPAGPKTVFPGCPCNSSAAATSFLCPAGYACSQQAYSGLSSDIALQPTPVLLHAECVPCSPGMHCPEGSKAGTTIDCPSGSYCPGTARLVACPAGNFCPGKSSSPVSCDYVEVLDAAPGQDLQLPGAMNLTAMLVGLAQPVRGNYCPQGSAAPGTACRAGSYCPNTTVQLPCPAGHFCREASAEPSRCSWPSSCPESSTQPPAPASLAAAFGLGGLVLLGLLATAWRQQCRGRGRDGRSSRVEEALMFEARKYFGSYIPMRWQSSCRIRPTAELQLCDLSLYSSYGKPVLDAVTAEFPAGQLHAVLGPAGAGQEQLLQLLHGTSVGATAGCANMNGKLASARVLRASSAYVSPASDHSDPLLTVRESLLYTARLALPSSTPAEEQASVVDDVLHLLALTSCKGVRAAAGALTASQCKRLLLAHGLVQLPAVMLVDELLGSLSPACALDVLFCLDAFAERGMNVIVNIQQLCQQGFGMFDTVLVMCQGQVAYQGPPQLALPYLTSLTLGMPPTASSATYTILDMASGGVPCGRDPLFQVDQLPRYWRKGGAAWLQQAHVAHADVLHLEQAGVVPAVLQLVSDEFNRLDRAKTGRLSGQQLVVLFERVLGLPLTLLDLLGAMWQLERHMARSTGVAKVELLTAIRLLSHNKAGRSPVEAHDMGLTRASRLNRLGSRTVSTSLDHLSQQLDGEDIFRQAGDTSALCAGQAGSAGESSLPHRGAATTAAEDMQQSPTKAGAAAAGQPLPSRHPSHTRMSLRRLSSDVLPSQAAMALQTAGKMGAQAAGQAAAVSSPADAPVTPGHWSRSSSLATGLRISSCSRGAAQAEVGRVQQADARPWVKANGQVSRQWALYSERLCGETGQQGSPSRDISRRPTAEVLGSSPHRGLGGFTSHIRRSTVEEAAAAAAAEPDPYYYPAAVILQKSSPGLPQQQHHRPSDDDQPMPQQQCPLQLQVPDCKQPLHPLAESSSPRPASVQEQLEQQEQQQQGRCGLLQPQQPVPEGQPQPRADDSDGPSILSKLSVRQLRESYEAIAELHSGSSSPSPRSPSGQAGLCSPSRGGSKSPLRQHITQQEASRTNPAGEPIVAVATAALVPLPHEGPATGIIRNALSPARQKQKQPRASSTLINMGVDNEHDEFLADLAPAAAAAAATPAKGGNDCQDGSGGSRPAPAWTRPGGRGTLRPPPTCWDQLPTVCRLLLLQRCRSAWPGDVLHALLLLAVSFVLGCTHSLSWALASMPSQLLVLVASMALLTALHQLQSPACRRLQLQLLSKQEPMVRPGAALLAQSLVGLPWLLLAPALLGVPYFYIMGLQMNLGLLYLVLLLVTWFAGSVADIISLLSSGSNPALAATVVVLLAPLAVLQDQPMAGLAARGLDHWYQALANYGFWAVESLSLMEFEQHRRAWSNVVVLVSRRWAMCGLYPGGAGGADGGAAVPDPQLFLAQESLVRTAVDWPCVWYSVRDIVLLGGCGVVIKVAIAVWLACRCRS